MHGTLCNYMITNDPDKIVMGVHRRRYLMLIYDVVLSVLVSLLSDVWNLGNWGPFVIESRNIVMMAKKYGSYY